MARGSEAKQKIIEEISKIFGDKVAKVEANKIYVNMKEAGETIQIAISLTQPKVPVGEVPKSIADDFDWGMPQPAAPAPATEITAEEETNLREMMARLGL